MRKTSLGNKHAWGNKKVRLGKEEFVRKTHPWGNKQGVPVRKQFPWGRISKVYCAERLPLRERGEVPLGEQARYTRGGKKKVPLGEQARCTRAEKVLLGKQAKVHRAR